jgi:hypothetical protein
MSAIASFYRLPKQCLPRLVEEYRQTLVEFGREPEEEYGWSGYCVVHLLTYLADRGVDLFDTPLQAEADKLHREDVTLLLTSEHKKFLPRLDPDLYDDESIIEHFEEMDYEFEEAPMAARDAIQLLHDEIEALDENEILIVAID